MDTTRLKDYFTGLQSRIVGELAALDGQPFFAEPSQRFIQTGEKEPGEPHSAYHEFIFKLRKIKERLFTPTARALAEQRHAYLQEFFDRLQAEWQGEK